MTRETFSRTKHKSPKFRELDDEFLRWEDRADTKNRKRKKRPKKRKQDNDMY